MKGFYPLVENTVDMVNMLISLKCKKFTINLSAKARHTRRMRVMLKLI